MDRVIASQQSYSLSSIPRMPSAISQRRGCVIIPSVSRKNSLFPSSIKSVSIGSLKSPPRVNLLCRSTGDSGENESRTVLDAFFLGKALGEVLNERIESSVGEFLSVVGRFQAEQQKQVLEFQEEVLEKARRAKEQASREALEAKAVIPDSTSAISTAAKTSVSKHTKEDPFLKGTN